MSIFFRKRPPVRFRTQEEVAAYWREHGAHTLSPAEIEDMVRLMVDDVTFCITTDFFLRHLRLPHERARVLDAGCGWGRSLIGIKRRWPNLELVGVDITKELLDLGAQITGRLGIEGITWQQDDLRELHFPDAYFDGIVSTRVLHYVVEPVRAVREMARVLKPGGRMIVMVPNPWNPAIGLFYHTKTYSPFAVRRWFENLDGGEVVSFGSLGFVPPFRTIRRFVALARLDPYLQRVPGLRYFGGLSYAIWQKR